MPNSATQKITVVGRAYARIRVALWCQTAHIIGVGTKQPSDLGAKMKKLAFTIKKPAGVSLAKPHHQNGDFPILAHGHVMHLRCAVRNGWQITAPAGEQPPKTMCRACGNDI